MSSLPVLYSRGAALWGHRKHAVRVGPHERVLEHVFSSFSYNDMKACVLLGLTMRRHPRRCIGGTLHTLFHKNPCYRKMPLFSHRAADCYILCYKADGVLEQSVRLSLTSCLDRQELDPENAIKLCTSMHGTTYCVINNESCATFKATSSKHLCLHLSANKSSWVL
ncbi:hypothetical protein AC1031_004708 [Aphanomyces cochlioides]|nr:hypothetical protein AC1031_004708 [Aphanomyces cochlioides]